MYAWLWDLLGLVFRSLKVIARWLLETHEIERILGHQFSNDMAYLLEKYIQKSRQLNSIQAAIKSPSMDANVMYQRIVTLKHLQTDTKLHQTYVAPNLKKALQMIQSYNAILRDLEESVIKFDTKNKENQSLLFQFWTTMDPLRVYSNLTNPVQKIEFPYDGNTSFVPSLIDAAWEFIGFQAEKPWTDFRGVGVFGLRQLMYFADRYPTYSQSILSYCMQHGQLKCFSYAITGINITFDVMQWFRSRKANRFYYKHICHDPRWNGLDAMHVLYCLAYVKFHSIWESNPPETVMEYASIHHFRQSEDTTAITF
eukprot:945442_1